MSQEEIYIKFPKIKAQFNEGINTFVINQMKCRTVSVVYMILHCYNLNDEEILTDCEPYYIGERWVVDETWSSYIEEIQVLDDSETTPTGKYIPKDIALRIKDIQIELVLINVDDDNPLYFTECMFLNKEYDPTEGYHAPEEAVIEASVEFVNNSYANLYNRNGDYLQVMRPADKASFLTTKLTKNECTVLAPHIVGEDKVDKPENLFLEFLYQTEQTVNIKPI